MIYPRKLFPEIKKHLQRRQITVITGMRRTGKTTIVNELLSEITSTNKLYLDLERLDNRELFYQKNYDNIIQSLEQRGIDSKKKIYLALDEIQLAPEISSPLKYLYDHYPIKIIVTGSSSYYLKNLFTESLAGRKKIFELFPLDFGEFLTFNKITYKPGELGKIKFNPAEYERLNHFYEEYLKWGGFPEVVLSKSVAQKTDLLSDIMSSYVNIDIKSLADFRKVNRIYQLIKTLAPRIGTKLDYVKLSNLTGISRVTVQNYLDLFEKTYLICRINVFTKSPDREIVKAKKVYFCDNGLLNTLGEIASGAQFENALHAQLRSKGELRYYALKTGREIDFILNQEIALEGKEKPTTTDLRELEKLSRQAGINKLFLIGRYTSPRFDNYIWGGDIK